jgi:virginiamycin B lyase
MTQSDRLTTLRRAQIVAAASLTIVASGCGNASLNPSTAGVEAPAYSHVPVAKDRLKIESFADLPQYSGDYSPSAIASGPKNSLWVTDEIDQDFGENAIVQIATNGKALNTFYYDGVATEGSSLLDIIPGPDGALWMTDYYNWQILRMTTAGKFTSFTLKTAPMALTVGPDNAIWFTEYNAIGRLTTRGKLTTYGGGNFNTSIAAGSDGALWFTEFKGNAIGRITTNGKLTTYTKGIKSGSAPYSIAAGPDGALWFTEALGGRIGRITTSGKVTHYSRGITPSEEPDGIAAGPDQAMWFTEFESYSSYEIRDSMIGRITMAGKISEHSKGLASGAEPTTIVAGPDGNMWFVESRADETGRTTL